jgi:hypothetical protein
MMAACLLAFAFSRRRIRNDVWVRKFHDFSDLEDWHYLAEP